MLKTEHDGLLSVLAELFTDFMRSHAVPPATWKRARLAVIFKNGEPQLPKNYRPISVIPVMAKLYSAVILERIASIVESGQIDTQFGNRKGRGCSDAVHVLRMVVEKSDEWGLPLWVAALDVEKAFDRVHHYKLLEVLLGEGVDYYVVCAVQAMYLDLAGYVSLWPGADSRILSRP